MALTPFDCNAPAKTKQPPDHYPDLSDEYFILANDALTLLANEEVGMPSGLLLMNHAARIDGARIAALERAVFGQSLGDWQEEKRRGV